MGTGQLGHSHKGLASCHGRIRWSFIDRSMLVRKRWRQASKPKPMPRKNSKLLVGRAGFTRSRSSKLFFNLACKRKLAVSLAFLHTVPPPLSAHETNYHGEVGANHVRRDTGILSLRVQRASISANAQGTLGSELRHGRQRKSRRDDLRAKAEHIECGNSFPRRESESYESVRTCGVRQTEETDTVRHCHLR